MARAEAGRKGGTCVEVAELGLAACGRFSDRPVHVVEVQVADAEVRERFREALNDEVRAMAR